jgi:hypothetical protein
MERTKWTDDLLDERLATVDDKLGQLQTETTLLRRDMNAGFAELRSEMAGLRSETQGGFAGIRAEMTSDRAQVAALHRQVMVILAGFMAGVLGLLAALVAQL